MQFPDLSDTFLALLGKAAIGLAGSVVSLKFIPLPTWPERLFTVFCGALVSFFGTPDLAKWLGTGEGLVGFGLGLFGMAVITKMWEAWQALPAAEIVRLAIDKARKHLGL